MARRIQVGSTRPEQSETGLPEPEWHRWAKTKEVDAIQLFEPFDVLVGKEGVSKKVMHGEHGDYLVWDGPDRCWPVPRKVFEAEHRRVG